MALNMSEPSVYATPADIQAELCARLFCTQEWLEDQKAKAEARVACLNQLKIDPFLSRHVTSIDNLSRQQDVQQQLLMNLDSVHAHLRRTIEQAQHNTSEKSEDITASQGAIPPTDASKQPQTSVAVKRENGGRSETKTTPFLHTYCTS